jgi:hypothetical protein
MHFFIWARLPSVQVSPHHRRSTSLEAFGTPAERERFDYIGLTLQTDNSKDRPIGLFSKALMGYLQQSQR